MKFQTVFSFLEPAFNYEILMQFGIIIHLYD